MKWKVHVIRLSDNKPVNIYSVDDLFTFESALNVFNMLSKPFLFGNRKYFIVTLEPVIMYKLYSRLSDHETVLECWGASTKHPDSIFLFSNFKTCDFINRENQIPAWIWECASKMILPIHNYELAQFGIEIFEGWW